MSEIVKNSTEATEVKQNRQGGYAYRGAVLVAAGIATLTACAEGEGVQLATAQEEQRATVALSHTELAETVGDISGECGDILGGELETTTTITPTEHEACGELTLNQVAELRAQESALDSAFGEVERRGFYRGGGAAIGTVAFLLAGAGIISRGSKASRSKSE